MLVATGSAAPVRANPPDTSDPAPAETDSETDGEAAVPAAPPLNPGVAVGSTTFERQLAEISFATFVAVELKLDLGEYACTEPESTDQAAIIVCFTIIDGERVIVAQTNASNGTGRHEFQLTSDHEVGDLSPADSAVLAHGESINTTADGFIDDYQAAEPRITDIGTFHFDPETVVLTLDITLADDVDFTPDVVAWVNTRQFAMVHWAPESPFRTEGATLRPGFTIVVDGNEYVSDFSLMVDVASESISQQRWLDIAER